MRRFTRLSGALLALVFVLSLLSGCGGAAPAETAPAQTAALSAHGGRRSRGRLLVCRRDRNRLSG